jgi:hypothetical protein
MATKLTLTNKKMDPATGRYLCDATCECGRSERLAFGYWSAIVCRGCGLNAERTPYRRAL